MESTQLIGRAKELEIAGQLIREGLLVFFPLVDLGADLVVAAPSMRRFLPVQVKYRKHDPALGLDKPHIGRMENTNLVLAFIIGADSETHTWYIPLHDFHQKVQDLRRRDKKVYITIGQNTEWLNQYEGKRGIMRLKKELKP